MTPAAVAAETADTRLIALLGDPVAHSLSPRIQNEAFRVAGVDGRYLALRCGRDDLPGLLRGIARAGGGGNVTLPHKGEAVRWIDEPTDAARRTRAVNTFWLERGRIRGDNTDVVGFREAARRLPGDAVSGGRVLVLGAGGAARGAVVALLDGGADRIRVLNRTPERARRMAEDLEDPRIRVATDIAQVEAEPWDLVVNATSLGLTEADPLPVRLERLAGVGAVLDLVYRPLETRLVRRAREMGLPAEDGGELLVQQGAASFERWWGRGAPIEAMREALGRARHQVGKPG